MSSRSSLSSPRRGESGGRRASPDSNPPKKSTGIAPQKLIRTDRTAGSLDAFLRPSQPFFAPPGGASSSPAAGVVALGGRGRNGTASGGRTTEISAAGKVPAAGEGEEEEEEGSGQGGGGKGSSVSTVSVAPAAATMDLSQDDGVEMCVCTPPEVEDGDTDWDDGDDDGAGVKGVGSLSDKKRKRTGDDDTSRKKKKAEEKKKKAPMPFAGVGSRPGAKPENCECCGGRPQGGRPYGRMVLVGEDIATAGDASDATPASQTPSKGDGGGGGAADDAVVRARQHKRPASFVDTQCSYHSVRSLISDFKAQAHKGLTHMLKKYSFVGMVDQHLSLLQFNTKLVLVNHTELSKEAFFQMTLRRFGVMPRLPLSTALPVFPLIRAALDLPDAAWAEADGSKDELAQDACDLLEEKRDMLEEYFKLKLSSDQGAEDTASSQNEDGVEGRQADAVPAATTAAGGGTAKKVLRIISLPLLLEGHVPVPEGLPMFLFRLATEVDWTEERTCFEGIAAELSLYYSTLPEGTEHSELEVLQDDTAAASPPTTIPKHSQKSGIPHGGNGGVEPGSAKRPAAGAGAGAAGSKVLGDDAGLACAEATAIVQHVMYPSFRWALLPPKGFATDGTVMQLACLERLYKVFERC